MRVVAAALFIAWVPIASAQNQPPSGQSLADAATFGAVATLAPLCGSRDDAWSSDLRRAAAQAVTGSTATDDAALSRAPGSGEAAAAIGYGDMEALEDFAAGSAHEICASLRENPALGRADEAVKTFRQRRDGKPVG